jgi:hypothetical protein
MLMTTDERIKIVEEALDKALRQMAPTANWGMSNEVAKRVAHLASARRDLMATREDGSS